MVKGVIAGSIIAAVIASVLGTAYVKAAREEMRTEVAKACIDGGGKYHETMFRRRPVCRH